MPEFQTKDQVGPMGIADIIMFSFLARLFKFLHNKNYMDLGICNVLKCFSICYCLYFRQNFDRFLISFHRHILQTVCNI